MSLFDPVFILVALGTLGAILVIVFKLVTGKFRAAGRVALVWLGVLTTYMAVVVIVAAASPGTQLAMNQDDCSDDWCMAVTHVAIAPKPDGAEVTVTFRVSSIARRVTQRERGVTVWVRDTDGRHYDGDAGPHDEPFDRPVGPGETFTTTRTFLLPPGAQPADVVLTRGGGLPFPGCCVIADPNSLLHRKTAVRIS